MVLDKLPVLSEYDIIWIKELISKDNVHDFYIWGKWKQIRKFVMEKIDHNECVLCKAKGKVKRAEIVHHVKHLRDRPDLALSVYQEDGKTRQLISVCDSCHKAQHPENIRRYGRNRERHRPLTEEKW